MEITKEVAAKVLQVVDAGLCSGKGEPKPGFMCVEAAVTYALSEPFTDNPSCVDPVLRSFKITLNDKDWSSNEARAKGLRRIAIAQLGTKGTLNSEDFVNWLVDLTIRKTVPAGLRAAAELQQEPHKANLLAVADRCETEGSIDACSAASYAASDAASYAASDAARAASDAASDAARAASYAARAASDAARAASYAARAASYAASNAAWAASDAAWAASYAASAASDAASNAAWAASNAAWAASDAAIDYDQFLAQFAEDVVKILIYLDTPGSEWLCLTEN